MNTLQRDFAVWISAVVMLFMLLPVMRLSAQNRDTSTVQINIMNMELMTVVKTDTGEFQHLTGHVILRQGTDTLYCDSAVENSVSKNFEAYGNVRIAQAGGTNGTCDYLKYTALQKIALMRGNVQLTDGKNHLTCAVLTYNLGTKMAVYDDGGKLHNDSTTVTSRRGEYDISQKMARFREHVVILDTQYQVKSEDLVYHTETKVTEFFARSVITRDSGRSILETANGSYDGKWGIAHFTGFSKIWNRGQYIEGDTLHYNKQTGYGEAAGHVVSIDTVRHSTMFCGYVNYHLKQRTLVATIKPVLMQVNNKDTLYIRADTFFSAPMTKTLPATGPDLPKDSVSARLARQKTSDSIGIIKTFTGQPDSVVARLTDSMARKRTGDSLRKVQDELDNLLKPVVNTKFRVPNTMADTVAKPLKKATNKRKKKNEIPVEPVVATDTTAEADSTAPLYFIGFHHVLIFSDSIQGRCDSVCYTRSDSLIRMMVRPVVWSHKSQVTGDTILLQLDSSTLRKMFVPNNAIIISQSGPEKANLYDQVQGRTLTAYFASNTITNMIVKPDAQAIYYSKDEKEAYLGLCQSTSERIFIYFDDQAIRNIKFDRDAHISLTPMEKADIPNARLSKFKWQMDSRPKSKNELFR